jgi:hypothetical protein
MRTRPISDHEWFSIRRAARCRNWDEVARRADELGWPIVAHHARRAAFSEDSLITVVYALCLDRPDEPDPFAKGSSRGA